VTAVLLEIIVGLILAVIGASALWTSSPDRKMKDGQPSMWALRAKAGFGLFILVGLYLTVHGLLRTFGGVRR
jgi:hypothetical protein